MAEFLDIVCLVFLGGWAYLAAKRKNRDEVGWAMIAAATFFITGLAASKVVFPALVRQGAFPALSGDPERAKLWQTASGFLVGVPCAIIVNLILTFGVKPLPPAKARAGGEPPSDQDAGPPPAGGGEAPSDEGAAAPPPAGGKAAGPTPAAQAQAAEGLALVRRYWPTGLVVLLYLVPQFTAVKEWLRARGYEAPYPPWREIALVPLVAVQVWLVSRRVATTLVAALFTAMFIPTVNAMEWRWGRASSYYSHGYLIPFVVLGLVWRQRERLRQMRPAGDLRVFGLGVLLLGLLVHLASCFQRIFTLQSIALVIVLCGLVFFLCGRAISRRLVFPLLFVFAMVPLPMHVIDGLSFRLKMFAAEASVRIVDLLAWLGVHSYVIVRDGSFIRWDMPSGGVDHIIVGDVCSGLRSLIALIAFGALFAYIARLSLTRKLILFAFSVPCAVVANMWRIVTLTFIGCRWGSEATHGTAHDVTGYGIFAVAFVLFFGLEYFLHKLPGGSPGAPPEGGAAAPAPA